MIIITTARNIQPNRGMTVARLRRSYILYRDLTKAVHAVR